ncbi:MAG: Npun_F5749 family FMN-dependent PPOX-type flavoprotein [Cyanobacteria bacterium J06627_32]
MPPSELTELAPWRSPIARALHRNRAQPFCRFLQLATLRPDGTPANRTVVFRGFAENGNQLMFISDRRSEKIAQIDDNPNAEVCWYFTKTREQFRLSGQLQGITADSTDADLQQLRDRLWQNISDNARIQFAWPQPKAMRDPNSEAFSPAAPDPATPLETFCLLLLSPHTVDYLSLRGEPQDRILYKKKEDANSDGWTTVEVNP